MLKLFIILVSVCLISGCNKTADEHSGNADEQFKNLSDEYIKGYLGFRPQSGTYLGLHEYDGKITDYSRSSIEKEIGRLKDAEKEFQSIDTADLSSVNYYDYKLVTASIKEELLWLEDLQNYYKNPITYAGAIDVNIYIKRNFAPLEERVRSIISIEKEAPVIFSHARENLRDTLAKPLVETAISVAQGLSEFLSRDLPSALTGLDSTESGKALMKEFTEVNNKTIAEINNYAQYLEKEKLPGADNNYSIGRDNYIKMLDGEMISFTPEKILEIGLEFLHKEQEMFKETAAIIDPGKSAIEVYKEIQKDHPTEESHIPDTRKNLELIIKFIKDKDLVTFPTEVRAIVEETPPYLRATSFASMDTPGPFEKKATEAYYYVTPVEKDWSEQQKEEWLTAFNYYTTDIVSIHEAYPGHYMQFLHLNSSPATDIEKMFGSYPFIEGWAHYTEQMMMDEGFASDMDNITAAKYRLAQLGESLLRTCRLCVSIMMHTQGMTVDEGTEFFMKNAYYEKQPASSEAIRGTYDPGYLFYTLGKLMIFKLREDYREQEGNAFTIKKFHDTMLDNGMPRIPLLREKMIKDKELQKEIL